MILIADSGSTKCDWAALDDDGNIVKEYKTMGLNPYYHTEEVIGQTVLLNPDLAADSIEFERVFFYGAGSSSPAKCEQVKRGLARAFPSAQITVDHDLVGAMLAVHDGKPGIICILGTGSNAVYYDGQKTIEDVPALGHVLGDEASGSHLGKRIITDYFYRKMPADIAKAFEEEYGYTKESVMEHVYLKPHANVFLASFSKFLSARIDHEYVDRIVKESMREFFDYHVQCYPNYKEVPVHFIGSIAYYFDNALADVCKELGITMGKTVKKPIIGIIDYHKKHSLPKHA